jgi:hypothetical protein
MANLLPPGTEYRIDRCLRTETAGFHPLCADLEHASLLAQSADVVQDAQTSGINPVALSMRYDRSAEATLRKLRERQLHPDILARVKERTVTVRDIPPAEARIAKKTKPDHPQVRLGPIHGASTGPLIVIRAALPEGKTVGFTDCRTIYCLHVATPTAAYPT